MIGKQAMMLALQDVFWLSVIVALAGVLAGAFIRARRIQKLTEEEKIILRSAMIVE
jgi:hypothetical protein